MTHFSDSVAKYVITAGGIGTILVAVLIVVVMISQLLPLTETSEVVPLRTIPLNTRSGERASTPKALGIDEYGDLCWLLFDNREIQIFELRTGKQLKSWRDSRNISSLVTCVSVADDSTSLLVGCDDGTTQVIDLTIATDYRNVQTLEQDPRIVDDSIAQVVTKLDNGLDRVQSIVAVTFHEPEPTFSKAVKYVDWTTPESVFGLDSTKSWSWGASDGDSVVLVQVRRQKLGLSQQVRENRLQWRSLQTNLSLVGLMVGPQGDHITTVDQSGLVTHWEGRDESTLVPSVTHWSISGSDSRVSIVSPLLGRNSLLIGCESGFVEVVSSSRRDNKLEWLSIHRFRASSSKVSSLDSASHARIVAVGHDDGTQAMFYVPSNRLLAQWECQPQQGLCYSANSKLLGVIHPQEIDIYQVTTRYPESGWKSFFAPIWYEGYDQPKHMWQSSTGTSQGEPKFGLMPLVFGTLKATFYSILIAAPIGFFAALFASECLGQTTRNRIKPAIEMMSSVPSVALGFIGAIVLAPLLREFLFAVLLGLPLSFIVLCLLRLLWAVVPSSLNSFVSRLRIVAYLGATVAGFWISFLVSSPLESRWFGGSLNLWLAGEVGDGWIGWLLLFLPPSFLIAICGISRIQDRIPVSQKPSIPDSVEVAQMGLRYVLISLLAFAIAASVATCADFMGFDPRGTLFGTYQERNALLVGIILGFAIIPLIYSLSEDALQAVPQHLRSASMSCGATTWQTTTRIVIPAAASGLFGALMLAIGRAIGETMVVLMAAGNTPIMDWSPFSGYRTLAATLATELPEAARGSTHFHTLFAAAAVLFCLTILVNSIAEVVRLHFRKRAQEL
jgi:phosphate transport system permease protein